MFIDNSRSLKKLINLVESAQIVKKKYGRSGFDIHRKKKGINVIKEMIIIINE